ncbi:hypothetical protein [Clostridium neonatale]|uniref:Uncharacterized protein n=1 Tax=Clostridium neonatale TaxID=137838 RepID=A0AA86JNN7_9CLOT|nr:hypothetical protein [Clostridium neonatale]MBP8314422.1 hypothetical protein [Clostridium neonatale]CAG9705738.1 conserved hypothetical protein [Clostridium neonatale]CAI3592780.1 conserved hypothetical protein [Clostridium neonatale]CAI3616304.1 conserved hypothetical protein [Clostridium neonatale]CAI3685281.1 conserved hypothetical protein [Clostridium neonatale]
MANRRFPKVGETVRLINCERAKKYKDKVFKVKRAPFVVDRDIAAEVEGVRGYIPVRYLEIIDA